MFVVKIVVLKPDTFAMFTPRVFEPWRKGEIYRFLSIDEETISLVYDDAVTCFCYLIDLLSHNLVNLLWTHISSDTRLKCSPGQIFYCYVSTDAMLRYVGRAYPISDR